jgi:hypothetical protein
LKEGAVDKKLKKLYSERVIERMIANAQSETG